MGRGRDASKSMDSWKAEQKWRNRVDRVERVWYYYIMRTPVALKQERRK